MEQIIEKEKATDKLYKDKSLTSKKRIEYFDIAKGIGIILMILGHCRGENKYIENFIYSFHMPLFFFISGYFFKQKENKELLRRNFKSLIIPYIITALLIIFYKILRVVLIGNYFEVLNILKEWGIAAIYGSGSLQPFGITPIGAIWFLLALFVALYLMNNISKTKYQYLLVAIIAYIGYKTSEYIWLPFSIQAGMVAIVFVYLGTLARKYDIFNKKIPLEILILLISIVIFCTIYCGEMSMVRNFYKNGIFDIIGAVCGTFWCIKISQIIEKYTKIIKKILIIVGKNSLICLCIHLFSMNCGILNNIVDVIGINNILLSDLIVNMLWIVTFLPIFKLLVWVFNNIKNKINMYKKKEEMLYEKK